MAKLTPAAKKKLEQQISRLQAELKSGKRTQLNQQQVRMVSDQVMQIHGERTVAERDEHDRVRALIYGIFPKRVQDMDPPEVMQGIRAGRIILKSKYSNYFNWESLTLSGKEMRAELNHFVCRVDKAWRVRDNIIRTVARGIEREAALGDTPTEVMEKLNTFEKQPTYDYEEMLRQAEECAAKGGE